MKDYTDSEFVVIDKPLSEATKCLNQWRHEYQLEIINVFCYYKEREIGGEYITYMIALVARSK